MSSNMRCEPCRKNCTGIIPYEQHLLSAKHKKTVAALNSLNSLNGAIRQPLNEASQMLNEKVIEKDSNRSSPIDFVSTSNSALQYEDENMHFDKTGEDMFKSKEIDLKSEILFSECNTCKKQFSGPEPYKQHIASSSHKRKIELERNGSTETDLAYSCAVCSKTFNGEKPYIQHLDSKKHQLKSMECSEEDGSIPKAKRIKMDGSWLCVICDVPCSGIAPFKEHLKGKSHNKKAAQVEMKEKLSKTLDFEISVQPNCEQNIIDEKPFANESNSVENKSHSETINESVSNMKKVTAPSEVTYLDCLSRAELEKSVKIFSPDDPINFD